MAIEKDKITLVLPMELTVTMTPRTDYLFGQPPTWVSPRGYTFRASVNLNGRRKITTEYHAIRDEFLDNPDTTISQLLVTLFDLLTEQVVGPQLKDEHTDAMRRGLMR